MASTKIKLRYTGEKEHVVSFPKPSPTVKAGVGVKDFTPPASGGFKDKDGATIPQTVTIRFDSQGRAECTADEWDAIKPHAANQGIVRA